MLWYIGVINRGYRYNYSLILARILESIVSIGASPSRMSARWDLLAVAEDVEFLLADLNGGTAVLDIHVSLKFL